MDYLGSWEQFCALIPSRFHTTANDAALDGTGDPPLLAHPADERVLRCLHAGELQDLYHTLGSEKARLVQTFTVVHHPSRVLIARLAAVQGRLDGNLLQQWLTERQAHQRGLEAAFTLALQFARLPDEHIDAGTLRRMADYVARQITRVDDLPRSGADHSGCLTAAYHSGVDELTDQLLRCRAEGECCMITLMRLAQELGITFA